MKQEQLVRRVELSPGDTVSLQNELLFVCVRRPRRLRAALASIALPPHEFGRADTLGLVGESAAVWQLREQIVTAGARPFHVLILGASGSGKELVARAIHELSSRRQRTLISRNAATIPEGLVDAELFGNSRGYPQSGMPERPGLIGAAHESSLFLDEIGELPPALQAHLLRVLDDGEYQRLGEAKSRRADIRLVAATNRPAAELKHDFLARFGVRLEVPDLNARREDVPLLVSHLLRRQAAQDVSLLSRYFEGGSIDGRLRVSPRFIERLLQHDFTTNVRELTTLLNTATLDSSSTYVDSATLPTSSRISATLPPAAVARAKESWLTAEESLRLELLRKYRFSPTSCGRDPAYPGNRQTADLHFRHLVCKALQASDWQVAAASRLLSGADPSLVEKCEARIATFLSNLDERLTTQSTEELSQALSEDWKGLVHAVLPVIERLRAKTLVISPPSPWSA